jgi:hypothetical protein
MGRKGFVPTDRVGELASRGFSEPEMIDVLRREGFSSEEIDNALTQSLKSRAVGDSASPQESFDLSTQGPNMPTMDQISATQIPKETATLQVPESSLPSEYYHQYPTEEYVDLIVQSRMVELNERLSEFVVRYNELERRVEFINEQLNELGKIRGGEQQQILEKIELFNESLLDSSSRMGSLEKAFKETLPALIESVRALTDLVQRMKKD